MVPPRDAKRLSLFCQHQHWSTVCSLIGADVLTVCWLITLSDSVWAVQTDWLQASFHGETGVRTLTWTNTWQLKNLVPNLTLIRFCVKYDSKLISQSLYAGYMFALLHRNTIIAFFWQLWKKITESTHQILHFPNSMFQDVLFHRFTNLYPCANNLWQNKLFFFWCLMWICVFVTLLSLFKSSFVILVNTKTQVLSYFFT